MHWYNPCCEIVHVLWSILTRVKRDALLYSSLIEENESSPRSDGGLVESREGQSLSSLSRSGTKFPSSTGLSESCTALRNIFRFNRRSTLVASASSPRYCLSKPRQVLLVVVDFCIVNFLILVMMDDAVRMLGSLFNDQFGIEGKSKIWRESRTMHIDFRKNWKAGITLCACDHYDILVLQYNVIIVASITESPTLYSSTIVYSSY